MSSDKAKQIILGKEFQCLFSTLTRLCSPIKHRLITFHSDPQFATDDGLPVTHVWFQVPHKSLLTQIGIPAHRYSTPSFKLVQAPCGKSVCQSTNSRPMVLRCLLHLYQVWGIYPTLDKHSGQSPAVCSPSQGFPTHIFGVCAWILLDSCLCSQLLHDPCKAVQKAG